jgi:hypothetical protein
LANDCYEQILNIKKDFNEAANLAISENLGQEKVRGAMILAFQRFNSDAPGLLGAARFASSAAIVLENNGYGTEIIDEFKGMANDAAVKAIKEILMGARISENPDKLFEEFKIPKDRQKEIATEAFDSVANRADLNYTWLAHLSEKYELDAERSKTALEGQYAQLLDNGASLEMLSYVAPKISQSKAEEMERNELLNMLRRGEDKKAITFIRDMATVTKQSSS